MKMEGDKMMGKMKGKQYQAGWGQVIHSILHCALGVAMIVVGNTSIT